MTTTLLETNVEPVAAPKTWDASGPRSEYFPVLTRSDLLVVVVLALAFVVTSLNRLNHTDLWGHLNYGRWIVEQGQLPEVDPFAAQPAARPFLDTAWLAQALGYVTWHLGGNDGLILGHALLVTLSCGLVMAAVAGRGTLGVWVALAAVAAYVLGLPTLGTIRPQLFGIVGLPAVLWACADLRTSRRMLLGLPLLFALWANLHGSFATGLIVLGLFAVAETIEVWRSGGALSEGGASGRAQTAWLALALSIAGCCANPLGWELLSAVATFGQHEALDQISEWRPLQWVSLTSFLLAGSLLVTALVAWRSPRRWDAFDVLLLLAFGGLTLTAMRMSAWWAIVWPVVMAPHARAAFLAGQSPEEEPSGEIAATGGENAELGLACGERGEVSTTMNALIALTVVFVAAIIAPPTHALLTGQQRGIAATTSTDTPLFVAEEIARRGLHGNFFAPIDWADYTIWQSGGRMHPLASSHVHLLDGEVWRDQQQFMSGSPDWLAVAERRGLKYLLLDRDRNLPLVRAVAKSPRCAILYQDQDALLAQILPPPSPAKARAN